LAKANGKHAAIIEAEKLQLTSNPFYHALLGYLYTGINTAKAKMCFEKAIALAKTQADRLVLQKKIDAL
jgi:predicted RNA polymerase sigma factor